MHQVVTDKHDQNRVKTSDTEFWCRPYNDPGGVTERGAEGDGRARVPRQAVPDRRGHRPGHEDEESALAQPPHIRTVQPAQVSG